MKKKFTHTAAVLVLLLTAVIVVLILNYKFGGNKDRYLLQSVIEIEKSLYEVNNVEITYSEFRKKTNEYLSDYFNSFYKEGIVIYANESLVTTIIGKSYSESDWVNLSEEEFKKIGEIVSESSKINTIGYHPNSIEISRVYEEAIASNTNPQYKFVYVKRIQKSDSINAEVFYKYSFINDKNKYILFSIEPVILNKDEILKYNDKKVEFIKTIMNIE